MSFGVYSQRVFFSMLLPCIEICITYSSEDNKTLQQINELLIIWDKYLGCTAYNAIG